MNIITCIDFSNNAMIGTMMKRFETQLCFVLVCFILNIPRCNIVNEFCFVHYFTIAFYIIFLFFLRFFNDPHFIRDCKYFIVYLWCDSN